MWIEQVYIESIVDVYSNWLQPEPFSALGLQEIFHPVLKALEGVGGDPFIVNESTDAIPFFVLGVVLQSGEVELSEPVLAGLIVDIVPGLFKCLVKLEELGVLDP